MNTLDELALKYGSDKYGHHNYTPVYYELFKEWVGKEISLLEIGIGGYHYPLQGGASLRMWREFFHNARIVGVDIYDKAFEIEGVTILQNDATKREFAFAYDDETFHAIIDDGSHVCADQIASFKLLFPKVKRGGYYIIEDCHTSYWEDIYGGHPNPKDTSTPTAINFFKGIVDDLNAEHIPLWIKRYDYESISFYKEMIVIKK